MATDIADFRQRIAHAVSSISKLAESPADNMTSGRKRSRMEALLDSTNDATASDTSAGQGSQTPFQKSCRPFNRHDYHMRLATFRVSRWFGKPERLSPVQCAAKGWRNVSASTLECSTCNNKIKIDLSVSTGLDAAVFAKRENEGVSLLNSGHSELCPWRTAKCPWHFMLPTILQPKAHTTFIRAQTQRIKEATIGSLSAEWSVSEQCAHDLQQTAQVLMLKLLQADRKLSVTAPSELLNPLIASISILSGVMNPAVPSVFSSKECLPALLQICGWEVINSSAAAGLTAHCRCCDAELRPSSVCNGDTEPIPSSEMTAATESGVYSAARKAMAAAARAFSFFKSLPDSAPETPTKRARQDGPAPLHEPRINLLMQHKWFCPWVRPSCVVSDKVLGEVRTLLAAACTSPIATTAYAAQPITEVTEALASLSAAAFGAATPSFLAGLWGISESTAATMPHGDSSSAKESVYPEVITGREEKWPGWFLSWIIFSAFISRH